MAELRSFVVVGGRTPVDVPRVELRDGFVFLTLPPAPGTPVRSSFELKLGGPEAIVLADRLARAALELPVVLRPAADNQDAR